MDPHELPFGQPTRGCVLVLQKREKPEPKRGKPCWSVCCWCAGLDRHLHVDKTDGKRGQGHGQTGQEISGNSSQQDAG